jgi:beta-glucanase (GH16 family)
MRYRTDTRFWSLQRAANVRTFNGSLYLDLKKETFGTTHYTGGGVISKKLFRYGYYEARMKVPPGAGWHSSFWMMKYNRPATDTVSIELDAIENDSITPLKYGVNTHRHLPTPHRTYGNKNVVTPSLSANYHVFGCEFTPTLIRYFFEGNVVQTVNATQFPHNDLNIWLTSIAAPLGGTTSVDDSKLPAAALYDYARFFFYVFTYAHEVAEPMFIPTITVTSIFKVSMFL